MDLISDATEMKACRFHESNQGVEAVNFSHGTSMFQLLLLLEHQHEWALATNNTELAVVSVEAMMGAARHLLNEPYTPDHETALYFINTACDSAEALLKPGMLTGPLLERLTNTFVLPESGTVLLRAYSAAFVGGVAGIDGALSGRSFRRRTNYDRPDTWPVVGPVIRWGSARVELGPYLNALDWGVRLMEALDAPFPDAAQRVAALRKAFDGGEGRSALAQELITSYFDGVTTYAAALGRCTLVRTACAVERYRLANDALPDSLDALVPQYIAALPADPEKGTPLRYAVDSEVMTLRCGSHTLTSTLEDTATATGDK
jgi:hypothetical protein